MIKLYKDMRDIPIIYHPTLDSWYKYKDLYKIEELTKDYKKKWIKLSEEELNKEILTIILDGQINDHVEPLYKALLIEKKEEIKKFHSFNKDFIEHIYFNDCVWNIVKQRSMTREGYIFSCQEYPIDFYKGINKIENNKFYQNIFKPKISTYLFLLVAFCQLSLFHFPFPISFHAEKHIVDKLITIINKIRPVISDLDFQKERKKEENVFYEILTTIDLHKGYHIPDRVLEQIAFRLNRELLNKDNIGKSFFLNLYPFPNNLGFEYPDSYKKLLGNTLPIYIEKEDYKYIEDPLFNFNSFILFLLDNFPYHYFSPDNHTIESKRYENFYIYLCKNFAKFYYLANDSILDIDSPFKL